MRWCGGSVYNRSKPRNISSTMIIDHDRAARKTPTRRYERHHIIQIRKYICRHWEMQIINCTGNRSYTWYRFSVRGVELLPPLRCWAARSSRRAWPENRALWTTFTGNDLFKLQGSVDPRVRKWLFFAEESRESSRMGQTAIKIRYVPYVSNTSAVVIYFAGSVCRTEHTQETGARRCIF